MYHVFIRGEGPLFPKVYVLVLHLNMTYLGKQRFAPKIWQKFTHSSAPVHAHDLA